jgi:hypothetical protein
MAQRKAAGHEESVFRQRTIIGETAILGVLAAESKYACGFRCIVKWSVDEAL